MGEYIYTPSTINEGHYGYTGTTQQTGIPVYFWWEYKLEFPRVLVRVQDPIQC